MPVYEYECLQCGKTFDEMQKFSDADLTNCRFCNSEVRKLFSPPAIIFKGSGWYVNDFPSSDRKKGLAAEKKENKSDSAKTSAKACATNCDKPCS